MCGPHVHYVVERSTAWAFFFSEQELVRAEPYWREFIEKQAERKCYTDGMGDRWKERRLEKVTLGGFPCYAFRIPALRIRAGVNIVTGEPESNPGEPELTEEEKDTLRWHFVCEYPTWRDLWRKHIKPHYALRGDQAEWDDAFMALTRKNLQPVPIYTVRLGDGKTAMFIPDFRSNLAQFLRIWRHRENRVGYWANPADHIAEPRKKVAFRWDAEKNSHAELMEVQA